MKKSLLILLLLLLVAGTACADSLLYRQQFDTVDAFEALGWDGFDGNTQCELCDGQLHVASFATESASFPSCAAILTPEQMADCIADTYTLQYDFCYETTSDSGGYLALLLGDNSSGVLPVVTARGKAKLYTVQNGKLTELAAVSIKDSVLNGRKSLSNLWLSMKVAVTPGHLSVSLRVPEDGGDWVEVLTGSVTLRNGLSLAAMGNHKGRLDTILLYNGSQAPDDGAVALIRYKGNCPEHQWIPATCETVEICALCGDTLGDPILLSYSGEGDDACCAMCGRTREEIDNDWLLAGVPAYEGGKKATGLYNVGQGIDPAQPAGKDIFLAAVSETCADEYDAYLAKLSQRGYTILTDTEADGNRFADLQGDGMLLHVAYSDYDHSVKVIRDTVSTLPATEFSYRCQGETETVLYQIGLPMSENGFEYGHLNSDGTVNKKIDCGMMYVIRLSDNSLFVIDGGYYHQFDDAQIESVMSFFREITGIQDGKIRIACWYFTHAHADHFAGMCRVLAKYHDCFTLERVMCNFPSINTDEYLSVYKKHGMLKLFSYLKNWFGDDIAFLKCHTGQQIQLADVVMDVLYTHEDSVDLTTGKSKLTSDENNASTVLMFHIGGKKFLLNGDINLPAAYVLQSLWEKGTLKCDALQLAHHGINVIGSLYGKAAPELVLAPVSYNGCHRNTERTNNMKVLEKTAKTIVYSPEGTAGFAVRNGAFVQVYEAPVAGGDYDGLWNY